MLPETVRARLDLSYDGTDFSGWATQPGLRTVQGVLEDALARIVRQDAYPRVTVAGRTDAGVHARGQVAHVDLAVEAWARMPGRASRTPAEALLSRLNGVLPDDVVVRSVVEAPAGFDARFSATQRRYAYRVTDAVPDVLRRRHVLAVSRPLDVDALEAASSTLTGLRDFAAFCRGREGATTIRDLLELSWRRETDGPDAGLVVATVRADAFCHSMVRSLVGALLTVGEGRRDLDWLALVAASEGRSQAIAVAPAHGLTLEEVSYPDDALLAARAEATRGRRTLP
ncbi:tRNA pseudouridine(38-40) synthase TruA [Demequina iriomotensis]|uniref:tRNA pseudouridine(38-40) synthase TruA n=1 Tax=Demequina iriomotensis TaxID=1536641 RepID=UPI000784CED5|nr:tRNA pseudouridine(38-40) synthase TruA [Demequina iriomotensis]